MRTNDEGFRLYPTPHGEFPSVTTIISNTKTPEEIAFWEELRSQQSQYTLDCWEKWKNEGIERGNALHELIENVIKPLIGKDYEEIEDDLTFVDDPIYNQFLWIFKKYLGQFVFTEQFTYHSRGYAGTADCLIREKDGRLTLIDWKTSRKRKKREHIEGSYFLQLGAYAQALREQGIEVHRARLLVAVPGGKRCSHYCLDDINPPEPKKEGQNNTLQHYTDIFNKRVDLFWQRHMEF